MSVKHLIFGACVILGLGLSPARADPYRWCALYSGDAGGASNCGFVTLAQCQATVSGIGGSCEPNAFYTGAQEPQPRPVRKGAKK
jgi:Protein of unknown function (DUF3551)